MLRRNLMAGAGAALVASPGLAAESTVIPAALPDGTRDVARYVELPGKKRMLRLSDRPPNYATPVNVFTDVVTPNDRFFIRYHLANIPTDADFDDWSLTISGDAVAKPVKLRRGDLLDLPASDVMAVCQCAGNRRGYVQPHVPGVEWTEGAMGCALWRGPALRDVLKAAGVTKDAVEIWFNGADRPAMDGTPIFKKSLPADKAMDPDTIIALSMNNAPLPLMNGFPARLVVPGWVGSYWMKHLTNIEASTKPLKEFWMQAAYRIPTGKFPTGSVFPTQATDKTEAIAEMVVNSIIASPLEGTEVERSGFVVQGVAWDRGNGINRVEVSLDGGANWQEALLDRPIGPYAFRRFTVRIGSMRPGTLRIISRATGNNGERQPDQFVPNPGGYHNNVPRPIVVTVT